MERTHERSGCGPGVAAIGRKQAVVRGASGAHKELDSAGCFDVEMGAWRPLVGMGAAQVPRLWSSSDR